jgi:hypothetical protein
VLYVAKQLLYGSLRQAPRSFVPLASASAASGNFLATAPCWLRRAAASACGRSLPFRSPAATPIIRGGSRRLFLASRSVQVGRRRLASSASRAYNYSFKPKPLRGSA